MKSDKIASWTEHSLLATATGNRFVCLDRRRDGTNEEDARAAEAHLAPELCRRFQVDGLLTMAAPREQGDVRMVLHNADGGRAEACGNGLRILTSIWHAQASKEERRKTSIQIETDAGIRTAWPLLDSDGRARRARVSLGRPRFLGTDERLRTPQTEVLAHLVDVGNPHCVLFVADLARVNIPRLGPALERHPRFPNRTNVEFVERGPEHLRLRVWERGVGETASCGSGVVAAAFVAHKLHAQSSPLLVETPGGRLRVNFSPSGEAHLEGAVDVFPLSAERHAVLRSLVAQSVNSAH